MKKPKIKHVVVGLLILSTLVWLMGQYDYSRLIAGKRPTFARIELHVQDGGSIWYLGLGYTVINTHQLYGYRDFLPDGKVSPEIKFRVGPTLDYWTPFCSRNQIRFIVVTNQ